MIRALAGGRCRAPRGQRGSSRSRAAILYCNLGDVTNLAVARGRACLFTRVSHVGLEAIAARLAAEPRPQPGARRPVALPRRSREPGRGDRGRPRDRRRGPRGARGGRRRAGRRAAPLARLLRRPGGRRPGRADRPLRPGQRDPRLAGADGGRSRPADLGRPPAGARRASTRPPRHGSPSPTAWRWRNRMRPVNLIPPEDRRGEHRAAAHAARSPTSSRRPGRRSCSGDGAGLDRQPDRRTQGRSRAARRRRRRGRPRRALAPYTQFRDLANSAWRPSPASPTAASTGSG